MTEEIILMNIQKYLKVIYGERKTKEEILSDTKEMKKENKAPVKKSVWVKPKSRVNT